MSEKLPPDEDRLLDHEYDGIHEYDNPLPRWWLWIFWVTILYSVLYVLNVPGIGPGRGRVASYEREMAAAAERYARIAPAPAVSEDALRALAQVPAEVQEGRSQFTKLCSPCHQDDGGGLIGPNLTDGYWIHGARPLEVYRTVHDGVAARGMPAWSQVMNPDQLASVVAYVLTLHGTTPHTPKGPEGVHADSAAAASGRTAVIGVQPAGAATRR